MQSAESAALLPDSGMIEVWLAGVHLPNFYGHHDLTSYDFGHWKGVRQ